MSQLRHDDSGDAYIATVCHHRDPWTACEHCAEQMYGSELDAHADECPGLTGCDVCGEPAVIREPGEAYCLAHAAELVAFVRRAS